MNTSYVQGQTVEMGELKIACLSGSGPTSYSQTTGDVVYNPGAGDYLATVSSCQTQSGNYFLTAYPTSSGSLRAGSPSPSQSGWKFKWRYSGSGGNFPVPGVPISLGPLSAAATQSTYTANGVMTVVGANTLTAGNFILLTNGASAAGIFLNGVIVQVTSATATGYTFNYGPSKSLNYTIATDTLKYQVIGASTGNLVSSVAAVSVTAVAVASNVLTVTCGNSALTIQPGQFVVLQGLAAGEVPQGAIVQVLTASTTQFTANLIAPNLSATSGETATASILITNGGAPIGASMDAQPINGSSVAATAATSSAAGAITVLPVLQNFVPGNIVVIQGLAHGAALNGLIVPVLAASLTSTNMTANGYIASAVTSGTPDLGTASLLVTGAPPNGDEVTTGTNLSGETVQFSALVTQM